MKIIADSGSTSTSWRIIDSEGSINQASTAGLNPYYSSKAEIEKELEQSFLRDYRDQSLDLYLYGSGCESQEMKDLMKQILSGYLSKATVMIEGDMLGAAHATCLREPGIVGILGTGSNSCQYDGEAIVENIDSLGYVMGDEGSGNHMGRMLMADYLRKKIPTDLSAKIDNRFKLTRDDILRKVYKEERPSRFLAQFARFIFQYRSNPYISSLISSSLHAFFKEHISRYELHTEISCHFVGSIAYYFSDYVRKVAKDYNVHVKNILEDPIAGLTLYHTEKV